MEPDAHGRESGVDEALHAKILQWTTRRYAPNVQPIIVLVSGDGNKNCGGTTFLDILQSAVIAGWIVEIYSFRRSCSRMFQNFASSCPSVILQHLDVWRDQIVYTKGLPAEASNSRADQSLHQTSELSTTGALSSRGLSSPSGNVHHPRDPNHPRHKTVPCRHFVTGSCRFGDKCTFLHDDKGSQSGPSEEESLCCICLATPRNCAIIP